MPVLLTSLRGAVLTVTLNRPEVLNALNAELLAALAEAWHEATDPRVRAVVLTGAGRGFCAGQDVAGLPDEPPVRDGLRHAYHPVVLALAALDKPVVAAVNGPAAGAGLALACAADIRVAAESAVFVPAYSRLGLVPDAGASWFVPRLIGYGRALSWLATGDRLPAERALSIGLVDDVVPDDTVVATATALAERLADVPGAAVPLTKRLLLNSAANTLAAQLEAEAQAQELARAARNPVIKAPLK